MRWWQIWKRDEDLERELQSDLQLEEEEQRERGFSPEEARFAASRALGNRTLIHGQTHEAWGVATFERLCQDIRYATRQLVRSPGFTVVAILTLCFGIGATTAIFTLVYDVMLRPLPFAQADRLVTMEETASEWSNIYPTLPVSANHFTFWLQNNRSFESMAIMQQSLEPLGAEGRPMQVSVLAATSGIFPVLQVQPQLGRAFTDRETQLGRERVVVLLHDLWRNQFGGDPGIIGKTVRLSGFPYTVIGVMPRSFQMPAVQTIATVGDAHRPLPIGLIEPLAFTKERLAEQMGDLNYFGLARLKPGVSLGAATSELNAMQHTISASLPVDEKATLSAVLMPFQQRLVGNNEKPLFILLVAVGGLLLVGCVNVANLLLARAVGQKRQIAVATALGARRAELIRMALREIAVLAIAGGGLGILIASAIVPAMQRFLPAALNFRGALHLDWAGAACALLLALLATFLVGAAPAFMVSRTAPNEVLHTETRLASESHGSRRVRRVLVGVEVTISVALVLNTGLLIASVTRLMHVDRGFNADHVVTASFNLPVGSYKDNTHRAAFYRDILERIARLPGVDRVAATSVLPLTGDSWGDMARVEGDTRPVTQLPLESFRSVSPDYFSTIHLPLLSGQFFRDSDWEKNLALVSDKTAQTLWPGKDPIGQQFSRGDPDIDEKPFTVVGVVANARTVSLAKPDPMLIYVPYWYRSDPEAGLVVRTRQDTSEIAGAIRQAIWSVDRNVPVPTVRAMGGIVADSVANQRFVLDLLLLFAISALLLAGLGVYGVMTCSVVQRHREIGLRMALGAKRATVVRLVLRDGLTPVAAGSIAGVGLAFASARLASSLMFQVSPYDPALAIAAVSLLLAVALVACILPARRAASVEPMLALRTD